MNKLLATFVVLLGLCFAQSSTPNIHLVVPAHGTPNWDTYINSDLSIIDTQFGYLQSGFQGVWSGSTFYHKGQMVSQTGSLYMSLIDSNIGLAPASNPSAWVFMVLAASDVSAFVRVDGTNTPFGGPIGTVGITDTGASTSFKNVNTKPYASKYGASDCGLNITAAITARVASNARGGVIEGDFAGGVCTGFTIPAGVTVHLWGGNYGFTSPILIAAGGHLIGDGAGNAGGTMIHGQGTTPTGQDLVQSLSQSGSTYWDDASIENIRIDMSQGGGTGTNAINIWQFGQSSHISNVEIYNALSSGVVIRGGSVPIVLDNVSVFKSAAVGFNIDFGLVAAESGNAFTCYSCTGDDNVGGLFRLANGADRTTALLLGAKGERKIGTAAQDPLVLLDHFSGSLTIDSLHAFSLTGGSYLNDVVKIVDSFTPGTPLHPDITIRGATVRLYTNTINDVANSKVVASVAACTLAAPCYIPFLHYASTGQYNFDDINGSRQSFASGTGSFLFTHRILGESFARIIMRTGSMCLGVGSADASVTPNCVASAASNGGWVFDQPLTSPRFAWAVIGGDTFPRIGTTTSKICMGDGTVDSTSGSSNCAVSTATNAGWTFDKIVTANRIAASVAAGTVPLSFASRTMGQDPVSNVTFANHPTVYLDTGVAQTNAHIVRVSVSMSGLTSQPVNLVGNAQFTNNSSFSCNALSNKVPPTQFPSISYTGSPAGHQFFVNDPDNSDTLAVICVGN